jgi:hypothetical protein
MTNTKQAAELTDERKAFEKWFLEKHGSSAYCESRWESWQARALLSAQANDAKAQEALYNEVKNMIRVKGRHNTEIAYQRLVSAFDAIQAMQTGSVE